MNKSLILNVLKIALLVLIGLGFFLPFVTGKVFSTALMAFVEFSDNLYNVDDFAIRLGNTADSTVLFVILYFVIALGASVVLFVKPAFSRVANLVAAGVGLGLYAYVYFQLFIDKSPELEAALASVHPQLGHTLTMNIGYGLFVGLIAVVLAVVVEFLGEKLVSFLK